MGGGAEQQEATSPQRPLHVVVFPWLAFGHLIPFLELSKQLARRGHAVTFVSTPRNVARLPPVPTTSLFVSVRLVSLPLPPVVGLPEGAESTADVAPEKIELLKAAFDVLAAPFAYFLASDGGGVGLQKRPDWIILDFAHHWLGPIAEEGAQGEPPLFFGNKTEKSTNLFSTALVPCALFRIVWATFVAYNGSVRENAALPPATRRRRRLHAHAAVGPLAASHLVPAPRGRVVGRPNASGVSDMADGAALLVLRSCPELDQAPACSPSSPASKSGPSSPPASCCRRNPTPAAERSVRPTRCMRWLDEQPPGSVVYVALGTEAPVTAEGVHELALGLELSGRASSGLSGDRASLESRRRVHGVGAAAGWGSVAESLRFGLPLVMLPFIVDQGLIARMMAERGVGVEVARHDGNRWFGRDDVAAAVRRVMVAEGKELASNARRMKEVIFGDDGGRQERYVDVLVDCLQRHGSEGLTATFCWGNEALQADVKGEKELRALGPVALDAKLTERSPRLALRRVGAVGAFLPVRAAGRREMETRVIRDQTE
ncbi:hypothetical protein EJB05_13225, partial [Eragrostis curvula]